MFIENSDMKTHKPKVKFTGILIPCFREVYGRECRFKLGTESDVYFLSMNDRLTQQAVMSGWEEVTIKGQLNTAGNLINVEHMTLVNADNLAS